MPAGSYMRKIQTRGRLIAGVSADTVYGDRGLKGAMNALYLKAPWEQPFEEASTEGRPFHPWHVPVADTLAAPTSRRLP